MDLSGCYFEYNGTSSRKYGLIFAHVNTEELDQLSGEIESSVIFNKKNKYNYFTGESFENSPLKFEAEIVTDNDEVINHFVRREVEKWLFHQIDYCKLYTERPCDVYGEVHEMINGMQKRLYLNCRLVNPKKIESGAGLVGYRFTVECDSCMAWQDPVIYEYSLSDSNSLLTINVDTDLKDYIYPKVTIQTGSSGGDIKIFNSTDDATRVTSFVDVSPNITITMRGDGINYISGDYYQRFLNKNFIRLLDGENQINITGNVKKITFEFQNRRYL